MMKPRILFILHLPPPVHGAAMMGKYINDSDLIRSEFECCFVNLATAAGLEDIGKPGLKKLFIFLKLLRKIRRTVKIFKPTYVYITPNSTGGPFCKDFVVVKMLKSIGCRVVAHYHNKGVSTRQNRWFYNILYSRFFEDLKLILLADDLYHDVEKYVRRENVLVCPNGIPDILPQNVNFALHKDAAPRLLFLSNLIESKGVLVLLDALKIVKDKGYTVACDFVGGETAEIDANRFEREVTLRQLHGIAVYHGKKYGSEKEEFWSKADAFVFPTFYPNECFPLVILEAMQHSLPCISTKEGAIPDMLEDGKTGFVVDRQSPEQTADAICKLLDSAELRRQMGVEGRQRYEQQFTLQAFERRMCDILHQLV